MSRGRAQPAAWLERARVRVAAAFWNGIAGVLPRAAMLLAGIYVARHFGADDFARYSIALVTATVAGGLPGATLGTVAAKFLPELAAGRLSEAGRGSIALVVLGLAASAAVGLGVWIAAPALARAFPLEPSIAPLLHVAALTAAAAVLGGMGIGLLAGAGRFRDAAVIQGVAVTLFAGAVVLAGARAGATGVLLAVGVLYFVAAVGGLAGARAGLARDAASMRAGEVRGHMGAMLAFFLPTLLAAGMIAPVVWACNAILAAGSTPLAEVARFNAAYNWYATAAFVPAVLAQVEFVRLSARKARGGPQSMHAELLRFVGQNLVVMTAVAGVGALAAGVLMGFFHVDDTRGVATLRILMLGALIASLGNPAGLFLAVMDRIWVAALLNIGWAVATVGLAWLLRGEGAVGVGTAFAIAYTAHFCIASICAWRIAARAPSA